MARGSIQKRGDSWTAIVDLPADPATGKRRQKRVTARTKREVEVQVAALINAAQSGFIDAGKVTVREYMEHWLTAIAPTLRASTQRRYRDLSRIHVTAAIGNLKLAKLSAADVHRLYSDRLSCGLSATSVRHIHGLLHRALEDAMRWGLLTRNVTEMVDPPRRSTKEVKTWKASQAASFLYFASDDDYEALWRLALLTGMRRGEILGLRWPDIDLERGTLSVRRTMSRGASSRLESGEPKTASARRRIALPSSLIDSLRKHRVRQLEYRLAAGPAFDDQELVFPNASGGPLHPNSLASRFRRLIAQAGLPLIRFHDLRHTCATLLLSQGVHPKVVQERLGHADIAMTMNLYSHVTPDMQRDAADQLDALISAATARLA